MQHTKNYNLKKPDPNDYAEIGIINENMDAMDEALHGLDTAKADLVDGKVPEAQLPDLDCEPNGTAASTVAAHNADAGSHQDIRAGMQSGLQTESQQRKEADNHLQAQIQSINQQLTVTVATHNADPNAHPFLQNRLPYVIGTYVGNYTDTDKSQTIVLGFKPSAVHVEQNTGVRSLNYAWGGLALYGHDLSSNPPLNMVLRLQTMVLLQGVTKAI